ncbi:MAG: subclass B3 metallo-beta-lactamase [Blastocatellia bacterium]
MQKPSLLRHRLAMLLPVVLLVLPSIAKAQADETSRLWNRPVEPFRIIGNVYYVGATEVSSFLITTPKGHILLDSGFAETVPLIQANFKKLGFKIEDVKILINSHAHYDHAGGLADLKELTGAKLMTTEADAVLLASGGKGDFRWGDSLSYKPVKADRLLRDNDRVELGGITLTARLTPGHTKGSTTWMMQVEEAGRKFDVIFAGSISAPGYKLIDEPNYPGIIGDYDYTFQLLKSLHCDVFLGPHGSFFSLLDKAARLKQGEKNNPFIDPKGYRDFIEGSEKAFREQLEKQRQARKTD